MWYIYIQWDYFSVIKRNGIVSFTEMWIDLETAIQSEISQKEKNKYCIISLLCGIQKNDTDELICIAKPETQTWNKHGYKGGQRGEMNWETETDIYTLLFLENR